MKIKKLTRSQNELAELGRMELPEHQISIVKIEVPRSGVTHVVNSMQRESKVHSKIPLSLPVCAVSSWDVQVSINELFGGHECPNGGELRAYLNAFKRVVQEVGARDVCIWLDHAGRLSLKEQENVASRSMWAADRIGIRVHLIYLFQRVEKWDYKASEWYRDWIISSHVAKRSTEFVFNDEGLDVLIEESDEQPQRAVRTA